jgi:hypothetical protein
MVRLDFNSRVLGAKAAHRLLQKEVTQTLRGSFSAMFLTNRLQMIEVALDGRLVGTPKYLSKDVVMLDDLTIEDARHGGFDSISELALALKRGGFRFEPLERYKFLRIKFQWL